MLAWAAEAIKLLGRLHVNAAVVGGRRSVATAVQHDVRENLRIRVARRDDVKRAVPALGALLAYCGGNTRDH